MRPCASYSRDFGTGSRSIRIGRASSPADARTSRGTRIVSSYALLENGDGLLLFDPLAVPDEIQELAAGRETAIVLTAPWHERDTRALVERHQWPLFSPPRESEDDLTERWGVTREQAAGGSPDLKWVGDSVDYHPVSAGERLLPDVESFPARGRHEAVYWVESRRALVVGDALADFGNGLEANGWPEGAGSREALVEVLLGLCSRCRSSSCFPRTAHPATGPRWSARFRDAQSYRSSSGVRAGRPPARGGPGPAGGGALSSPATPGTAPSAAGLSRTQ